MPNYGLYYTGGFTNRSGDNYRVDILQQDYTGNSSSMLFSTSPAVHAWDTDDPKAPIKGSSLQLNILNQGTTPIDKFYSALANTFKTRLYWEDIQNYNGNATIVVTNFGDNSDIWLSGFYPPTGNAKKFTFKGITYDIISYVYTNGVHIRVTRIPAATYSDTDYTIGFQVDRLQFEGFLVQDDFIEDLADITHEFTLSANDALGLLKDLPFNEFEPVITIGTDSQPMQSTAPHTLVISEGSTNTPKAAIGDTITITGTPFDGVYTVNGAVHGSGESTYTFDELIVSNAFYFGTFSITRPVDFGEKLTLLSVLQCCLNATGLQLNTNIYANLFETSQSQTMSFLEQTLISTDSFLTDAVNYQDCYTVLTNLMQRFNMSIFQSHGEWHVMRWDELRLFKKVIPYYKYDSDFARIYNSNTFHAPNIGMGTTTTPGQSQIVLLGLSEAAFVGDYITVSNITGGVGNGTYAILKSGIASGPNTVITILGELPEVLSAEADIVIKGRTALAENFNIKPELVFTGGSSIMPITGATKRPFRAFRYAKETFNYRQPSNLLKNENFQTVGPLLRTSTTGSGVTLQTITEYSMPDWFDNNLQGSEYFIRVTQDYLQNELSRYGVVKNGSVGSNETVAVSSPIEVNVGDNLAFAFTFKTSGSQPGTISLQFIIKLTNGTTTRYAKNNVDVNGTWENGQGWTYVVGPTENTNTAQDVNISIAQPIPFDGLVTVYLGQSTNTMADPTGETLYNNLKFTYTPLVAASTKVTGQTNECFQSPNIKNNADIEIFMDTATRNSINGTLFVVGSTNLIQNRAAQFVRTPGESPQRLGQITTTEQLFWRRIARTLVEGSLYGLVQNDVHISMLSVATFSALPGINTVFGKLSIDYMEAQTTGTQYETYNDSEKDSDLSGNFDFEYLYSTQ